MQLKVSEIMEKEETTAKAAPLTPLQTAWGIVKVLACFAVFFGLLWVVDQMSAR